MISIWSMRMEQYLTHTDYDLWEVIVNGDAPAIASASAEAPIEVSWNHREVRYEPYRKLLKAWFGKVFESASDSSVNDIEEENNQVNDRFKKVERYHAVLPPYIGNYMPSKPDLSFAGISLFCPIRTEWVIHNMLQDQGIFDSGCSRHMTRNKSYLTDYQDIDRLEGFVAFARSPKGGKITRKGKIRTGKLDFKDTECLVLSPDFKLLDESQVLLKVPRQNNMYSFDLKNIVPSRGIETNVNAGQAGQEKASDHEYILLPLMLSNSLLSSSSQSTDNKDADEVPGKGDDDLSERNGQEKEEGASNKKDDQHVQDFKTELDSLLVQQKEGYASSSNRDSTASPFVSTAGPSINTASENINTGSLNINTASPTPNDSSMQSLENTGIFDDAYNDRKVGAEADINNLETSMNKQEISDGEDIIVRNKAKTGLYKVTTKKKVYQRRPLFVEFEAMMPKEIPDEFYSRAHFLLMITASTPIETNKALIKDEEAEDVDVHLYRSMTFCLEHAEYDESNTYVLERFNTTAGNPVKKILLKLNLSDHRLCKMVVECQSVKVKEFQERCNIKAFQEWYEHVGPEVASPQGGKVTSWRRDYAWLMISRCSRSLCQIQVQGTSSNQEVNDHYNIFTRERQEYELKTKDKA
ncbi:hypothetical protein Tco_1312977 [Tanacetum coccineum]